MEIFSLSPFEQSPSILTHPLWSSSPDAWTTHPAGHSEREPHLLNVSWRGWIVWLATVALISLVNLSCSPLAGKVLAQSSCSQWTVTFTQC